MSKELEEFYQKWADKSEGKIKYDNEAAIRKIDVILHGMPVIMELKIETIIDFGCGYGKALHFVSEKLNLKKSFGFDFSESSINYAVKHFGNDVLQYHRLENLDIDENLKVMQSKIDGKVDCILLIDVLEHVPDCKKLMLNLSELTQYFIIKLPIEENILANYLLSKEYPSTSHSNGHLREFNANSVYYFIRSIGLTPLAEGLHIYDFRDSYPPQDSPLTMRALLCRNALKYLRMTVSWVLPMKIYIRLFGPGSYYCIATFSREHILNPY